MDTRASPACFYTSPSGEGNVSLSASLFMVLPAKFSVSLPDLLDK
jgi:hypothetical protein